MVVDVEIDAVVVRIGEEDIIYADVDVEDLLAALTRLLCVVDFDTVLF